MMRQPLACLRKNGPLQVVVMSLMLIVTSVVVDNNPASGLSCDRTTNDYTGWRKKEWMDSWFNKKIFIPDIALLRQPNSKSMYWEKRSKSANGRETIMRFQLLPDGKMIVKMNQTGFSSIQRYKCDKTPTIVKAERKEKRIKEAKREAELAAKKKADEKAKLEAEIAAKLEAEMAAKLEAEMAAKLEAEMAAKKKADEEAKKKAELAAKKKADEKAKKKSELAVKREANEEARKKAELAAKKKADEKAKKKAELAAKKKADELAKKKAKEIKLAQDEIVDLREASIEFVKTGESLDVLAWSEYLGKLPSGNNNWNTDELEIYQEFRKFAFSTEGFEDFFAVFLQRKQVLVMKRYDEIMEDAKKVESGLSEAVVETIGTKSSKQFSTALKALQKAMEPPKKITSRHNIAFDNQVKRQGAILESYQQRLALENKLREQIKIVKLGLEKLDKSGLPSDYKKLINDTVDELVEVVADNVSSSRTLAKLDDVLARANRALNKVKNFQKTPSKSGAAETKTEVASLPKEFSLDQTTNLWNEGGPAFSKFREKWIRRNVLVTGYVTEKMVSQDGDTLYLTLDPNPRALYRNATAEVHWVEKEKIALIQQSQLIGQLLTFEGVLSSFNEDRTVSISDSKFK